MTLDFWALLADIRRRELRFLGRVWGSVWLRRAALHGRNKGPVRARRHRYYARTDTGGVMAEGHREDDVGVAADAPPSAGSQEALRERVYRKHFLDAFYWPLERRLDVRGQDRASAALNSAVWALTTGPELALMLAEDCETILSPVGASTEQAGLVCRGLSSDGFVLRTGHLAMEAVVRTLHSSGDYLGQMLNNSVLSPAPLPGRVHVWEVKEELKRRQKSLVDVESALDRFLTSPSYRYVAAASNQMKHNELVQSSHALRWDPDHPDDPVSSLFKLLEFDRDETDRKGTPKLSHYAAVHLADLGQMADELRSLAGDVMKRAADFLH
jgi:hypothetical protein